MSESEQRAAKAEEEAFPVEHLAERARTLFDLPPHVVSAVLGQERRKTHTVTQARSILDRFLKAKVKPAEGDDE